MEVVKVWLGVFKMRSCVEMGGSGGGTELYGTLNEEDIAIWDTGGEKYEGSEQEGTWARSMCFKTYKIDSTNVRQARRGVCFAVECVEESWPSCQAETRTSSLTASHAIIKSLNPVLCHHEFAYLIFAIAHT